MKLGLWEILSRLFGLMKVWLPIFYILGAAFIWWDFARTNPDGLANIWIVLYTFPIAIVASVLLRGEFPYVSGHYDEAHALYFWPSVVVLAVALFLIFHGLQKITQAQVAGGAQKMRDTELNR